MEQEHSFKDSVAVKVAFLFQTTSLQTWLFACSGSGSFIFALRGVELITQSDAETLLIGIFTTGTEGTVAINGEISVGGVKEVFRGYRYFQWLVFQERFGQLGIHSSFGFPDGVTLFCTGWQYSCDVKEPAFWETETVVKTEIESWFIPVLSDAYTGCMRVVPIDAGGELRLPDANLWWKDDAGSVSVGMRNACLLYTSDAADDQ